MSDFEKLIATVTSSNNAAALRDKEQLDQDKKNLEVLRTSLENLGGKAEDNKAFNKAALKVQMDEFDLRKNLATGSAAKEEIEKERQKALGDAIGNSKTFQGISGALSKVGGFLGGLLKGAADKGKGLLGTLFKAAGLGLLIAFLNSDTFKNFFSEKNIKKFQNSVANFIDKTKKVFNAFFGEDGSISNGLKELGVTGSVKLVAAIVALGALLAPSLVLAGVKTAIKGFTAAIAATAKGITSLGRDTFVDDSGKTRNKKTGAFAKKEGKLGGVKAFGKGLLRGAKFLPVVGVGVTALMGLFDGVTAGLEEAKNENATKSSILRESIAGIGSGLTFGLISQETISKGITSMATSVSGGFDKTKKLFTEGFDSLSSDKTKKLFTEGFDKALSSIKETIDKIINFFTGGISSLAKKLGFTEETEAEIVAKEEKERKELLEKQKADAARKKQNEERERQNKIRVLKGQLNRGERGIVSLKKDIASDGMFESDANRASDVEKLEQLRQEQTDRKSRLSQLESVGMSPGAMGGAITIVNSVNKGGDSTTNMTSTSESLVNAAVMGVPDQVALSH